jgi:hypothetical protein
VRSNQFGFTITGDTNLIVVVEASDSLTSPAWVPKGTNTLASGPAFFSDPEWWKPSRFYRLRSP